MTYRCVLLVVVMVDDPFTYICIITSMYKSRKMFKGFLKKRLERGKWGNKTKGHECFLLFF